MAIGAAQRKTTLATTASQKAALELMGAALR
jgi:hypothetical protein